MLDGAERYPFGHELCAYYRSGHSEASIWSVWVEKELLRAIHYFQHASSKKIIVLWVSLPVSLDDTPMAYPMEGLQIAGRVFRENDVEKYLPDAMKGCFVKQEPETLVIPEGSIALGKPSYNTSETC